MAEKTTAEKIYSMPLNSLTVLGRNEQMEVTAHRVPGGWNYIYKVYDKIQEEIIGPTEHEYVPPQFECYVRTQFIPFSDEFMPKISKHNNNLKNEKNGDKAKKQTENYQSEPEETTSNENISNENSGTTLGKIETAKRIVTTG